MSSDIARRFTWSALRWAGRLLACTVVWHAAASFGVTPLSDLINSQANYMSSYGYMHVRLAEARKINAEAVALEIDNSVKYVEAYFKRREINKKAWREANPNYMEIVRRRESVLKERVEKQYQEAMHGNVTEMSNWLLRELSNSVVSYQYVLVGKNPIQPELDFPLTHHDLKLIWLTDGGRKGSQLRFRAADGNVLAPKWPLALRGRQCEAARDNFERTRDAVVKEVREKGEISPENQTKLMQAVNGLYAALDTAYPSAKRDDAPQERLTYLAGRRFVQTLVAAAHRAISINDASVFSGQLRFEGNSLFGLIQHMYRHGLEFAPPEPGGEGAYQPLYTNLRQIYMKMQSAPEAQQRNATETQRTPDDPDKTNKDGAA
ncbi:MAG: hypothetical protein LLG00_08780 [Planctomycetaceae bacterium]|nr:hypothetical protein [Planctomycetaceae bacterium]